MPSTKRRSIRLQTVDNDKLADSEFDLKPTLTPKRQIKTPKSKLCIGVPICKPCGRPRQQHHQQLMSDQQVARKLHWHMRRSTMGKRVGDAARTIFLLSRQWPWELVKGFAPAKWGIEVLESMRKLSRILKRNTAMNNYGKDFQVVKDFLRNCAMKRDRKYPRLKTSDVLDACAHFNNDDYVRRETIQITATAKIERYKAKSRDESVEVKDESESDAIEVDAIASDMDSDDEWEDWIGYTDFGDDVGISEQKDTAATTKRSRSPSCSISQDPKRARTSEPNRPRPQNFSDLMASLQVLQTDKQKELENITTLLREVTASIQASETSQTNTTNATIKKLCSDVKVYETEREKILKGRKFVEEHHEDMAMGADDLAKTLQQYTSRLEECDKLTAQANADVLEELDQIAQQDFDLKDEEERLEGREKEVLEDVGHYGVIGTMMRLGPGGMAELLGRLEGNGVSLVEMAESIMNESE
ncbi:hypothetical protein FBEOM_8698 [Fusarium beomiforme]|uniref:Uncharacterized protein n=1 Tax=Fusarium beomiforme TaxID=44412 RepID=A0A9P5DU88_9HYPO|nr:hypothetical protein FBEOM_8698 [Fusarium beomiforme]